MFEKLAPKNRKTALSTKWRSKTMSFRGSLGALQMLICESFLGVITMLFS
jgi:2-hydroxy-3-keto-5-methylthiopentenyl-1-phosphate phosphatase